MPSTKRTILFAAASVIALTGAQAVAQESRSVDIITVTAQKREQGIQDVPVAVTAYGETQLTNAGVHDLKDLAIISPGLNVTSTTSEFVTTARIRGIGTVGDNPGLESSVGIVIDGVPRARNGVGFNDLGELERIEVLRGPQGTLFGANTTAGIINVVTKRPEFEFGYNTELTYVGGDTSGWGAAASITGPITDRIAARVYGATRQRDGYQTVEPFGGPRTQTEDGDQNFFTFRGQVLIDFTDHVNLLLSADITERDENCCGAPSITSGATAGIINALVPGGRPMPGSEDPFSRTLQANRSNGQEITDQGFSAQLNWEFDNFDMTAILSDRTYELRSGQDTDFTGADIVFRDISNNTFDFGNTTFELRFSGATENVDWMFGSYYSSEDLVRRDAIQMGAHFDTYLSLLGSGGASISTVVDLANGLAGLSAFLGNPVPGYVPLFPTQGAPLGGGNPLGDTFGQDGESLSFFTHNTWHLTDSTDISFGLRHTTTQKTATFDFGESSVPACDVWEHAFGDALDFSTAGNQALLSAFSGASGVSVADLAQFGTFTCLPFSRDVFARIDNTQTLEENEFSGLLSLSHRFNDDLLMYGTYSHGYKAGGFNLDRFTQAGDSAVNFTSVLASPSSYPARFDPETVDSFEIGIKTEWANDSLLANFYLFQSQFDTYQLNTFNGIAFFVTSIDGASTQGAEMELLWLPESMPGLTMQGGITYADASYDEFAPTGTPDVDVLSGRNFSLAPEWYASSSVTYNGTFGENMTWLAHLDARYMSEQNTGSDLDPEKIQEAYTLFNGRVGIGAADETWSLELWGRNLTDEDYLQVGFDGPFQPGSFNGFLGTPRSWGITLRARR
ncbi:TonB-dependent receptor [Maricaulis salignorans]|uniref:Iron complex outermembrane recepter protein n=1 Tax=Maricaulis salignorans TaxID=144026 RepID=A0A1G9VQ06_9PROT|nr:TonB-dependent receptor [Maricaulis salignorans]SDM74187.1 iron complex outermembrane recepter protein [Maricaulis salignorans]